MTNLLLIAMGYLLGSIPFGVILTRLFGAGDLRQIGSGNIGATNVLRTGRKGLAAATLILDGAKGAVAVLLARQFMPETGDQAAMIAGAAAMIGHCYPVWLKFRGGKGVATLLGLALALAWPIGLIFAVCVDRCGVVAPHFFAGRDARRGRGADRGAGIGISGLCNRSRRARGDRAVAAPREYRAAACRNRAADWRQERGCVTHAERLARLRLIRTPHVGPVSWHQLMQRFGSGEAALDALPDLVLRGGAGKVRIAPVDVAEREFARAAELGARHVFSDEPEYSSLLREVEGAPPVVIVRGDTAMLQRPCVAIVGARNASAIACRFARQLAADLAARDVTVVSGLARGVDTAAHIGALGGSTVGVIASGIDIAFPPENAALQEKIATDQLLVAEQPTRQRAAGAPFPIAQPDHRRAGAWHGGDRGGAALGVADHGAPCGRLWA